MIWLNPWAWAGLLAVAVPVLIHLLGRGYARVQRFPTLRFLEASRLLPTRRTRVHDLVLLAIRAGVLVAAVAALAQPFLLTANRRRTLDAALARAVVIDTSTSMRSALVAARLQAKRIADSAQTSVLLETNDPSSAIAGAAAWLSKQPARGELVVLSDFQTAALAAADLEVVPATAGIRLVKIPAGTPALPIERRVQYGDSQTVARAMLSAERTDAEWSRSAARGFRTPVLLAGPADRLALDAALRAAATVGVLLPVDTNHAIGIVYPTYGQRAELLRSATSLRAAWMADVIARIAADSLLAGAAGAASEATLVVADSGAALVVAHNQTGRPAVLAAQDHDRLLLFALTDASSLASAALIAATARALSRAPAATELDPATIPDATLASWQRAPSAEAPSSANRGSASDGRWLWLLALILLGIEWWARRSVVTTSAAVRPLSNGRSHAA
ncbi:MAG: putative rane protein [Gemmatimonadetes bacterium]|nr:putative rane protein [Gemmatimonadota bacterium]